jgi:flagellar biogenesis protein FliO
MDTLRQYLKRVTILVAAVTAGLGGLWYCRCRLTHPGRATARGSALEIVEQLAVGPRCFVQLIRVNEQFVLLGRDHAGLKMMLALSPSFASAWEDPDEAVSTEIPNVPITITNS